MHLLVPSAGPFPVRSAENLFRRYELDLTEQNSDLNTEPCIVNAIFDAACEYMAEEGCDDAARKVVGYMALLSEQNPELDMPAILDTVLAGDGAFSRIWETSREPLPEETWETYVGALRAYAAELAGHGSSARAFRHVFGARAGIWEGSKATPACLFGGVLGYADALFAKKDTRRKLGERLSLVERDSDELDAPFPAKAPEPDLPEAFFDAERRGHGARRGASAPDGKPKGKGKRHAPGHRRLQLDPSRAVYGIYDVEDPEGERTSEIRRVLRRSHSMDGRGMLLSVGIGQEADAELPADLFGDGRLEAYVDKLMEEQGSPGFLDTVFTFEEIDGGPAKRRKGAGKAPSSPVAAGADAGAGLVLGAYDVGGEPILVIRVLDGDTIEFNGTVFKRVEGAPLPASPGMPASLTMSAGGLPGERYEPAGAPDDGAYRLLDDGIPLAPARDAAAAGEKPKKRRRRGRKAKEGKAASGLDDGSRAKPRKRKKRRKAGSEQAGE